MTLAPGPRAEGKPVLVFLRTRRILQAESTPGASLVSFQSFQFVAKEA